MSTLSQLPKVPSAKGTLHQLLGGRSSSDGVPNKSNSLSRDVASFDAKFAAVPTQPDGAGGGVAGGRGFVSSGSISNMSPNVGVGNALDDTDHTLSGLWEHIWEHRLQRRKYYDDVMVGVVN